LNDTGGRKGDQQRIKVFIVMLNINIKHERGCLLSMSFLLEGIKAQIKGDSVKAGK
jgi:hypothetical protein